MILVEFYLTLEQADTVPDDAAKGYGRNASLARAGAEGAKPCATATSHTHIPAPQRSTADYSHVSHHDTPACALMD